MEWQLWSITFIRGENFCQSGGSITVADLTVPSPAFGVVTQQVVETLNPLVGAMIR